MAKKSCLIVLAVVLLAFLGASRSEAIMLCEDCGCGNSCTTNCVTDSGWSTCGVSGTTCAGRSECGGGDCLTATQANFILGLLDREPRVVTPVEHQRGRAAARLTWRLTQFAEESGVGEVYTPRTAASPDLAFVSRERLAAGRAAAPDLVVMFAPSRKKDAVTPWLAGGARAVLVLDPAARTIEVHENGSPRRVLGAESVLALPDLLPGWSLSVGDLFQ